MGFRSLAGDGALSDSGAGGRVLQRCLQAVGCLQGTAGAPSLGGCGVHFGSVLTGSCHAKPLCQGGAASGCCHKGPLQVLGTLGSHVGSRGVLLGKGPHSRGSIARAGGQCCHCLICCRVEGMRLLSLCAVGHPLPGPLRGKVPAARMEEGAGWGAAPPASTAHLVPAGASVPPTPGPRPAHQQAPRPFAAPRCLETLRTVVGREGPFWTLSFPVGLQPGGPNG